MIQGRSPEDMTISVSQLNERYIEKKMFGKKR